MVLLAAKDIRFGLGGETLLDGLSLQIEAGERVCLLGLNGCGKTTLLRILDGQLAPDGGQVDLSLHREQDSVVLSFTDNGVGIRPAILPRIFEPFYTTRGIASGGNQPCDGLGLSVVHGIVKELGGSIGVTSKVGEGTTFTIRLPWQRN